MKEKKYNKFEWKNRKEKSIFFVKKKIQIFVTHNHQYFMGLIWFVNFFD